MLIISDASPIICFIKIDRLTILHQLFGRLIIPPAVWNEINQLSELGYDLNLFRNSDWIEIRDAQNHAMVEKLRQSLDRGESEAIALASELHPDYLLIDERLGTLTARNLGIHTIGVIGIIIRAKDQELIPLGKPILDKLRTEGRFWISEKLYISALIKLNEQ